MEQNRSGVFQKAHIHKFVTIFPVWWLSGKARSLHLIWLRTHSVRTALSLEHLLKNISGNCLISQLPEGAIPTGINRRLTQKILRRKTGEWNVDRGLWKAPSYSWKYWRPCTYVGLCECQGKTSSGIKISALFDHETLHGWMWRLRQSCKLPAEAWKACPNTYTHTWTCAHAHAHMQSPLAKPGRLTGSRHLHKSLSNHHITISSLSRDFGGCTWWRMQILQN